MSFLYDLEEHEFAIICIVIISLSTLGIVWWLGPSQTGKYPGTIETITSKYTSTGVICSSTGKSTYCYPVTYYWTDMMVHFNKTRTDAFHQSGWSWNKGDSVCVTYLWFRDKSIQTVNLNQGAC